MFKPCILCKIVLIDLRNETLDFGNSLAPLLSLEEIFCDLRLDYFGP